MGHEKGVFMKKLALATAAVLALLSIAGCGSYVGKGKAPPPSRRAKWLHQLGKAGAGFAPARPEPRFMRSSAWAALICVNGTVR